MMRWMLIGIHVKLWTASQVLITAPFSETPAGDIMKVSQALAMSMIAGADHVQPEAEQQVDARGELPPAVVVACRGRTPRRRRGST